MRLQVVSDAQIRYSTAPINIRQLNTAPLVDAWLDAVVERLERRFPFLFQRYQLFLLVVNIYQTFILFLLALLVGTLDTTLVHEPYVEFVAASNRW